jgi:hypothetical protein
MLLRLLALLVVAALVLLPGLHVHGATDATCLACVYQSGVAPAPEPAGATALVAPAATGRLCCEAPAALLPRISIFRPVALSPPVSVA